MRSTFLLAGAVLVVATVLTGGAFAGANDYVFEPVKAEVKQANDAVVAVRLKHKATGKPVTDAVIDRCGDRPDPDRHGAGRHGDHGVPAHGGAEQRARRLCLQGRAVDGGPLALEHLSQGAGRTGNGGRQDHVPSDQVTSCVAFQA